MTDTIERLKISEPAGIEPDAIDLLKSNLGLTPGRDVVERAAFEISDRLTQLDAALIDGQLDTVARISRSLVRLSDHIGMHKFSNVSNDLARCVEAHDFVAIASVSRRLQRLGETSLFAVVDMADSPMSG